MALLCRYYYNIYVTSFKVQVDSKSNGHIRRNGLADGEVHLCGRGGSNSQAVAHALSQLPGVESERTADPLA